MRKVIGLEIIMEKDKKIEKEESKKQTSWLIWLVGLTLVACLVWVSLQSYHYLVKQDRLEDVEQLLIPLDPNLRTDVLDKIEKLDEYHFDQVAEYLQTRPVREERAEEDIEEEMVDEEVGDDEVDEEVEQFIDEEIEEEELLEDGDE